MDELNTPPLLGNSPLRSSNAGRFVLQLPPYPSSGVPTGAIGSNAVSVLAWETEDNEQQELELLAWFETNAEGSGIPDNGSWPDLVNFNLTKNIGAQGGPGISVEQPLSIPINGLRMRFTARAAVLRCWSLVGFSMVIPPITIALRAAIYPVVGNAEGPEVCISSAHSVQRIPKGARSFRVCAGVLDSANTVEFFSLGTLFTGAGDVDTTYSWLSRPVASFSNQLASTWTAIPRGAYWFLAKSSYAGPVVGQPQGPAQGAEVFFR